MGWDGWGLASGVVVFVALVRVRARRCDGRVDGVLNMSSSSYSVCSLIIVTM